MLRKLLHLHPIKLGIIAGCVWVLLVFLLAPVSARPVSNAELYELTNETRTHAGLPALSVNENLENAAYEKALHILEQDYWAHTSPDGTTPWVFLSNERYRYINAGENLARGYTDADRAHKAWLQSPTHYANIVGDYDEIGIAVVRGELNGEQTTLVVAMYATPTITISAQ